MESPLDIFYGKIGDVLQIISFQSHRERVGSSANRGAAIEAGLEASLGNPVMPYEMHVQSRHQRELIWQPLT